MALNVPNVGEGIFLAELLKNTTPEAQTLALYTNNITPGEGDTTGTYTQASGNGADPISLTRASWAAPTTGDPTYTTYPQQTWNFSGPVTVYGYLVKRTSSLDLMFSELIFAGGQAFENGDSLKLTLRVEMA